MADSSSPERSARRTALLTKLAARALERAGVTVGGQHLLPHIVELVQRECEELRARCFTMISSLRSRGVTLNNPEAPEEQDALELLAYAVAHHYVDEHGDIQIAFPDDDEPGAA